MIDSSPSSESNRQNVTGAAWVLMGSDGGGQGARAQQGDASSQKMNASSDLFFCSPLEQRVVHFALTALRMARLKISVCSQCPRLRAEQQWTGPSVNKL